MALTLKGLEALDYFVKLILDQLRKIFLMDDVKKNFVFELDEIETILKRIFHLDESEMVYVIYNSYRFEAEKDKFEAKSLQLLFWKFSERKLSSREIKKNKNERIDSVNKI